MFFLQKKKDIVGVDLGSSSVKLVQLRESKGKYTLENFGIHPLPPEAIVDNTLMDTTSIVEAIKSLIQTMGVKTQEAVAALSGNSVIIRKIMLQAMPVEELEEQIHWEAEQHIPFDINDVNIDFQILGPDSADPGKMHVLLVASKKDVVNDYVSVFTEAGLRLSVIDVDSFAVQNAFEINYQFEPDESIALINIGASVININIIRDGISLFTRDVQMGGNLYSEEIQKQLGVSTQEAETIKFRSDHPDQTLIDEIFNRTNDSVTSEIKRSLDFFSANSFDSGIAKIFLSGGAAKTPNLAESIQVRLDTPVEIIDPFRQIAVNEKAFDLEHLQEVGPIAVVAVGLATRRAGDK